MDHQTTRVDSEIDVLRTVIIHRPDEGIARISPKRAEELLFDDIVFLPKMQEEHEVFTDVLDVFLGKENVLEAAELLRQSLKTDQNTREKFLREVVQFEELPRSDFDFLNALGNEPLAEVLITGYHRDDDRILFDPIPNFIFTRDIAAVVNDHVIISKASKSARQRENLITQYFFSTHPMFETLRTEDRLINLNRIDLFPPSDAGERVSVEGGDLMMIEENYLLIGCSERTTSYAFESIKETLFNKGIIDHVVKVTVPPERSFMHIDTLFTRVSENHLVVYKPIVYEGLSSRVDVHHKAGNKHSYPSIKDFFLGEINPEMEFIFCGEGVSPYQEREQWTDGCNLVAVREGVALMYDRNYRTIRAFRGHGYDIVPAEELLREASDSSFAPSSLEQTIITLSSGELSRARGGSHCMTCPIHRSTDGDV